VDILFSGTVSKEADYADQNEDTRAVDAARGRIVVCDGATESFDAKGWASALRDLFARTGTIDEPGLEAAIQQAAADHDVSALSWSLQAAWERGSFATLLGLNWDAATRSLRLCCVGDSLFLLRRQDGSVETFPYQSAQEFTQRPQLLSTVHAHNAFITDAGFTATCLREWHVTADEEATVLCMTDALGAWLLAQLASGNSGALDRLAHLRDEEDLVRLVELERAAGRMRRDDTTLVVARLDPSPA
jgi:hypothetical protein